MLYSRYTTTSIFTPSVSNWINSLNFQSVLNKIVVGLMLLPPARFVCVSSVSYNSDGTHDVIPMTMQYAPRLQRYPRCCLLYIYPPVHTMKLMEQLQRVDGATAQYDDSTGQYDDRPAQWQYPSTTTIPARRWFYGPPFMEMRRVMLTMLTMLYLWCLRAAMLVENNGCNTTTQNFDDIANGAPTQK